MRYDLNDPDDVTCFCGSISQQLLIDTNIDRSANIVTGETTPAFMLFTRTVGPNREPMVGLIGSQDTLSVDNLMAIAMAMDEERYQQLLFEHAICLLRREARPDLAELLQDTTDNRMNYYQTQSANKQPRQSGFR